MNNGTLKPAASGLHIGRLALLIGAVLASISLLWSFSDPMSIEEKFLSSLVILVAMMPLCWYFASRLRSPFMIFELHCAWYAINFGMNGFFEVTQKTNLVNQNAIRSLELTLEGLLVMIAAFAITRKWILRGYGEYNPFGNLAAGKVELFGWISAVMSLSAIFVPAILDLPSIGTLIGIASLVGTGILYALYLRGRLNPLSASLLFFAVMPIESLNRLNSGQVFQLLLYFLTLFVVRLAVLNRISIFFPVLITGLFILVNPVKLEYRKIVWKPGQALGGKVDQLSSIDKASLFLKLMNEYWLGGRYGQERTAENLRERTNNLFLLRVVEENTPSSIPYWNGLTYELGVYVFIPRAFWPGKPAVSGMGNDFGRRYFIIAQSDNLTTINLSWIVEAYANFGESGIVIVMAMIGLLFACMKYAFGNPYLSRINSVLFISLTISLAIPESNIIGMCGGLGFSLLFFLLLAKVLTTIQNPAGT